MPNLLHVLPAFADEAELRLNTIVELNSNTINKYELITETGHLKLDRVGYSSLAYPLPMAVFLALGMRTEILLILRS
jgi:inorganic pyrophosphatase